MVSIPTTETVYVRNQGAADNAYTEVTLTLNGAETAYEATYDADDNTTIEVAHQFLRTKSVDNSITISEISGLTLWLDAADSDTLWQDTAGTTPATTTVARWDDKSGNGYNATQATGASQPTTGTRTVNSKPVLSFDGTNDNMALPSGTYSIPAASNTLVLIYKNNAATAGRVLAGRKSNNDQIIDIGHSSNEVYVRNASSQINSSIALNTDIQCIIATVDSTGCTVYRNGRRTYKLASAFGTLASLVIGSDPTGANYANTDICEIAAYNRVLTEIEINSVLTYARLKWNAPCVSYSSTERALTVKNDPPWFRTTFGGTRTDMAVRFPHKFGRVGSKFRVSHTNAAMTNTGVASSSDLQIIEMSVESPSGTVVPIYFNGSRSVTIRNNDYNHLSDYILPSSFGLSQFAKDEIYWIKAIYRVASGSALYCGTDTTVTGGTGSQVWTVDPASTTVSSVDTAGVFTYTGTAPTNTTLGIIPIIVGEPTNTSEKTVMGMGDSIANGTGDGTTVTVTGNGFFRRAVMYGSSKASLNFSSGGITALYYDSQRLWENYVQYADMYMTELGTNDIGTTGTTPVATTQGYIQNIWGRIKLTSGRTTIVASKLLLRTSSTDSWATEANQTTYAGWTAGDDADVINVWLDDKVTDGTITATITYPSFGGTDAKKWASPKVYNDDDVHPNTNGHTTMATYARAVIDSL